MPFKASEYPENWKDEIRPAILKRDGYKCKECGLRQRAFGYRDHLGIFTECDDQMAYWAKKNGFKCFTIYLSVAHTCHDSMCENEDHMKSLCQRCHNHQDQQNRIANRKYKLNNQHHVCSGRKQTFIHLDR